MKWFNTYQNYHCDVLSMIAAAHDQCIFYILLSACKTTKFLRSAEESHVFRLMKISNLEMQHSWTKKI